MPALCSTACHKFVCVSMRFMEAEVEGCFKYMTVIAFLSWSFLSVWTVLYRGHKFCVFAGSYKGVLSAYILVLWIVAGILGEGLNMCFHKPRCWLWNFVCWFMFVSFVIWRSSTDFYFFALSTLMFKVVRKKCLSNSFFPSVTLCRGYFLF
jgi:hypothetical protein